MFCRSAANSARPTGRHSPGNGALNFPAKERVSPGERLAFECIGHVDLAFITECTEPVGGFAAPAVDLPRREERERETREREREREVITHGGTLRPGIGFALSSAPAIFSGQLKEYYWMEMNRTCPCPFVDWRIEPCAVGEGPERPCVVSCRGGFAAPGPFPARRVRAPSAAANCGESFSAEHQLPRIGCYHRRLRSGAVFVLGSELASRVQDAEALRSRGAQGAMTGLLLLAVLAAFAALAGSGRNDPRLKTSEGKLFWTYQCADDATGPKRNCLFRPEVRATHTRCCLSGACPAHTNPRHTSGAKCHVRCSIGRKDTISAQRVSFVLVFASKRGSRGIEQGDGPTIAGVQQPGRRES
ncbi:Protein of unknown function [Gryllus bimaculatus]|nr:Protein of unknown function [Gryllus bimaculatus]